MNLQKASRKKAKIKLCLQGPSGSGKTYSALLLAFGLCNDWSKIAVIDTENHSAELYSHLGEYNVIQLDAPFTPESYIKAIQICEQSGIQVMILDSITHEWEHILESHASLTGNSFSNWQKVGLRHKSFMQAMLSSKAHIIATIRTKQDYVLNERNGKLVPEKVGLKAIQREGLDYEFTVVFDLNIKNNAAYSKDRTGVFFGKPEHIISIETGRSLLKWCNEGKEISVSEVSSKINKCKTISELITLFKEVPQFNESLKPDFEKKKRELVISSNSNQLKENIMKKECVSEIELVYRPAIGKKPVVQTSYEAYVLFKEYFDKDTIAIKEQFVAMYLNQANRVIGIHKLSEGGITNTLVDTRILFGTALKSLATSIIVCHNHPSGNMNLSNQDKLITNRIIEIGQLLEIRLLDHLIITPFDSYVSMSDENLI